MIHYLVYFYDCVEGYILNILQGGDSYGKPEKYRDIMEIIWPGLGVSWKFQ